MAIKTIKAILRVRRGSFNQWQESNPILKEGQMGLVSSGQNKGKFKIGDGITAWNDLDYNLADGIAATIEIKNVTTVPFGNNANVMNKGTPNKAELEFIIPGGKQGNPGTTVPDIDGLTELQASSENDLLYIKDSKDNSLKKIKKANIIFNNANASIRSAYAHWSCEDLPEMPDNQSGVIYKNDAEWTGWSASSTNTSGTIERVNGVLRATDSRLLGLQKTVNPGDVVVFRVRQINGNSRTTISVGDSLNNNLRYHYFPLSSEWKVYCHKFESDEYQFRYLYREGYNSTSLIGEIEVSDFYIGNATYLTPLVDNSGNGRNINITRGAVPAVGPNGRKALQLFGGGVSVNDRFFSGFKNFTWSFWSYTEDKGVIQRMLGNVASANGASVYRTTSGIIYFYIHSGGAYRYVTAPATKCPFNEWLHVIVKFDFDTKRASIKINNEEVGSTILPDEINWGETPLALGAYVGGSPGSYYPSATTPMQGMLSDIAIFDRLTTEEEDLALYMSSTVQEAIGASRVIANAGKTVDELLYGGVPGNAKPILAGMNLFDIKEPNFYYARINSTTLADLPWAGSTSYYFSLAVLPVSSPDSVLQILTRSYDGMVWWRGIGGSSADNKWIPLKPMQISNIVSLDDLTTPGDYYATSNGNTFIGIPPDYTSTAAFGITVKKIGSDALDLQQTISQRNSTNVWARTHNRTVWGAWEKQLTTLKNPNFTGTLTAESITAGGIQVGKLRTITTTPTKLLDEVSPYYISINSGGTTITIETSTMQNPSLLLFDILGNRIADTTMATVKLTSALSGNISSGKMVATITLPTFTTSIYYKLLIQSSTGTLTHILNISVMNSTVFGNIAAFTVNT